MERRTSSAAAQRNPSLSGAKIKGAGIHQFFEWWNREGDCPLPELVDAADPRYRHFYDRDHPFLGLMPASWYPCEAIHAVLDVMMKDRSPEERREIAREGARDTLGNHVRGLYRFLFKTFVSPERYAKNSQKIFARYYSDGKLSKTIDAPNRHSAVLTEWRGHHEVLCDTCLFGGELIYELLGCRDVRAEKSACTSRGDQECRWTIEWRS